MMAIHYMYISPYFYIHTDASLYIVLVMMAIHYMYISPYFYIHTDASP